MRGRSQVSKPNITSNRIALITPQVEPSPPDVSLVDNRWSWEYSCSPLHAHLPFTLPSLRAGLSGKVNNLMFWSKAVSSNLPKETAGDSLKMGKLKTVKRQTNA